MRSGPDGHCESPRITACYRGYFRPTVGKRRLAVGAGSRPEDYVKENCLEMNGLRVDGGFSPSILVVIGDGCVRA